VSDIVSEIFSRIGTSTANAVDTVIIETDWTPRLTVAQPLASGGSGIGGAIAAFLKPRAVVTFTQQSGIAPMVYAPYGNPTPISDDTALLVGVAWGLAGIAVAYYAVKGFLK
jgi:hypothetical protein